ncbi:MAG: hydrolase, partial [Bacillota bacterium]|nr:hydrolase [Bacillota bacterium]
HPDFPIISTGVPTDETRRGQIEARANAITYTPKSNGEIYREYMVKYRKEYEKESLESKS